MKKIIIFPAVAILLIAVALLAFFFADRVSQVHSLENELSTANSGIASLNKDVSSLQTSLSSVQGQLAASQSPR